MKDSPRRRTRARKVALLLGMLVVMYAAMELILFAAVSIRFGRVFSFTDMEARRREVDISDPFGMGDVPTRVRVRREVNHPYMGYVYDPAVEESSPYGISDVSPVQPRRADAVVIAIFGGSFAQDVAYVMGDALAEQLKPHFPGKELIVVKSAIGGYKQPQQLMALNYFSALGGQFDIVINLDGFNEIALPALENLPQTNPFFPRQWHLRMRMVPDREFLASVGKVRFLDSAASRWADLFYTGPLRYSVTANTIWRIGDQLLYNAMMAERAKLPQMGSGADDYAATGPPIAFDNDGDLYTALARMWAESSYQMHGLARARGFRYFHFLQPNQYLDGTKPMGAQERAVAVREDHPYAASVRNGYPVLRELGEELRRRGVNFVDLTHVFADTRETLYRDNCCHVNRDGLRIVVAAMTKSITAQIAR